MKRTVCIIVLLSIAAAAYGTTGAFNTKVQRVLSDTVNFGGCMAQLVNTPSAQGGLDCNGSYVTFSCTGDFAPKDAARRNFEIAQIALVTGNTVRVDVDDTKKHNGYCFARRIDLFGE